MNQIEQRFQQAITLHQSGQLSQAVEAYRKCLALLPDNADCHHMFGLAQAQLGELKSAEQSLQHAVTLQPRNATFLNNLAEVQRKGGNLSQAIANFTALLELQPNFATGHYNLALAYKANHQWSLAEQHLRSAIALQPDYTKAHYNLGNLYLELGRYQEAESCFEEALRLKPDYIEALLNLGSAHQQMKQYDSAIISYRRALSLDPESRTAQLNLATSLQLAGGYQEAVTTFRRLAASGDNEAWYSLRAEGVFPAIAESNGEIDALRHSLQQAFDRFELPRGGLDMASLHSSGLEPPAQLIYQGRDDGAIKRRYAELFSRALPAFEAPVNREKPRIGFVVTTGHEGVFCKCMGGIIQRLPNSEYDTYVVCQAGNQAYLKKQLRAPHIQFVALPRALDQARELLARHAFDLLHYWEVGTDSFNYFLPLLRPASIQCSTWGWPVTSGMEQMDHFISAEPLELRGAESHYSERLVQLPSLPSYYQRPQYDSASASIPELPPGKTRYLCTQNLRKVHPDLDPLLAGILRQSPGATAIFIEDRLALLGQQLRQRWQQAMPDVASRIYFVPQQSQQDYLALVAAADVILDTPHYCGGANTTYDALALGKIIVTQPGEFHRSRYCSAAYRQLGITDSVASTAEEYIEIAVRIGRDREYRKALEQGVVQRNEVLFEDQKAVDELNDFLLNAVMAMRG